MCVFAKVCKKRMCVCKSMQKKKKVCKHEVWMCIVLTSRKASVCLTHRESTFDSTSRQARKLSQMRLKSLQTDYPDQHWSCSGRQKRAEKEVLYEHTINNSLCTLKLMLTAQLKVFYKKLPIPLFFTLQFS